MILRNENQGYEPGCGQTMSAFEAIAAVQKNDLLPCWFVTQPDHAHLSGMIADGFDRRRFPELTADVVEAIGLHDEGWEIFDGSAPGETTKSCSRPNSSLSTLLSKLRAPANTARALRW